MNIENNPKVITVVWSGGFDSTFVLLDECDKAKNDPNNIYIQCVTTSFDNTGTTKNAREKDAREKIKRYISRTYPSINISYANLEMKWDNNEYRFNSSNEGLSQPIIWICSLLPLLDRDTIVKFGYLKCDDAMSSRFKQDVIALFDAASKLVGKNIKLELPLENYDKNYVISYLMNEVTEVFEYCTSCENSGTNDKCGHCVPCQHLRETLIKLCVDGSPSTRNSATRYLKDWFDIDITVKFNEEPLIKATDELCEDEKSIESESFGLDSLPKPTWVDELAEQVDGEITEDLNSTESTESPLIKPVKFKYVISHTPYRVALNGRVVTDLIDGESFPDTECYTTSDARIEVEQTVYKIKNDILKYAGNVPKVECVNVDGLHQRVIIKFGTFDNGVQSEVIDVYARRFNNE